MTFDGFPREGLELLRELGQQDKTWFDAHKKDYTRTVVEPAKAFVSALGEHLQMKISAGIVAQPKTNGSISPINNDLRFAKDKTPYKDHLLFRFWDGPDKKTAPTLFVRLSADVVGFATGAALPALDRWRAAIDDDASGMALAKALKKLSRGRELEVAGAELKRVPAPFLADHPRADLLRHKGFQARWPEPTPPSVGRAAFVSWCGKRLSACAPIHHWLVSQLGD